jgi:ABC-type phosphate/phosphonate transport system substrate-binding protein
MIASARMYEWSASLTAAWGRLLRWVVARADVPPEVESAPTASLPLDEIWQRDDLGCVFMCGYPWRVRQDRPHLLAAPVPSPARYGSQPVYFTDFVVRADSSLRTIEDTFGGTIAYSQETSHSGYNAARFHLLGHRRADRPALYGRVLGPLGRQLAVIDAVIDGKADVGPIDGFALDLLRRHGQEREARVRIVATTVAAPSAPLVASPMTGADAREHLADALCAVHAAPEMASTLDELLLSRFVRVTPAAFDVFLDRQRAAEAAGYPKLA